MPNRTMLRGLSWLCAAGAITLGGCGSASTTSTNDTDPVPAVLTGMAAECSGPANLPAHPVQVIVYRGSHVVVRQTKLGSHPFRFSLPAGRYTVTTNQSYAVPVTVTLNSGGIASAEVGSACS
jgi:hypothetical protein